jgi:hypothetical protein
VRTRLVAGQETGDGVAADVVPAHAARARAPPRPAAVLAPAPGGALWRRARPGWGSAAHASLCVTTSSEEECKLIAQSRAACTLRAAAAGCSTGRRTRCSATVRS